MSPVSLEHKHRVLRHLESQAAMTNDVAIRTGQIWKEKRFPRYVRIVDTERTDDHVAIITCDEQGETLRNRRVTYAWRKRFDGRSQGYALHRDITPDDGTTVNALVERDQEN